MNLDNLRPTWLEIDLDAIRHNIKAIKNYLSDGTEIMAIVKANAYGHGVIEIANLAISEGATYLGVATVAEGVELREAGIDAPILILGTILSNQIEDVINYQLTPNVYTYQLAKELSSFGKELKIHIKLDTGMGRIGLLAKDAVETIKRIDSLTNLKVEGLFSHFAVADSDQEYTLKQLKQFKRIIAELEAEGIKIPIKHLANSAGAINYPKSDYDLVRAGIILYGLYPDRSLKGKIDLKPALSWKSKIVHLKEVRAGTSISYGCTYITKKKTKVATLPVGYHDGYSRVLSGQSYVLYNGEKLPIIGRICMDQLMVDMTGTDAKVGETVTLVGEDDGHQITADELAAKLNTINYEFVSRIAPRVPRVFYSQGEVVGVR